MLSESITDPGTIDMAARHRARLIEPRTPGQLWSYVRTVLRFAVPRAPIVAGHHAPFDYLAHSFFEGSASRDCIVWANRGGGKTQLAAVATLLDLLFKPGIQIRILGGSFEQSSKMHVYLRRMIESELFCDQLASDATQRAMQLVNGSRVEVLSQSERAVRGQRIHKLRCDEVELFDQDVWEAAQLVTRTGRCGAHLVRGAIDCLSTMHRPFGLMHRLVRDAANEGRAVFRWSVLDALERCPPERECARCSLWPECGGRAKRGEGFITIDDALRQRARISPAAWRAEMLCEEPTRSDTVYPMFEHTVHVRELPRAMEQPLWLAGLDFGYRNATVFLWACEYRAPSGSRVLHIADELVREGCITERFIAEVARSTWPRPAWIGADPAGGQRSAQTGISEIALWKRAGFAVRTRASRVHEGIDAVRRRLRSVDDEPTLFIAPRCSRLVEALTMYHYPPDKPESLDPVKDGSDHAADALRYLIINLDRGDWTVRVKKY
ncbi:MAG TPA: hypothetical protein PK400_07410 [Phycisphaerales bacterium]|nr:hypothetical protein [Phycisphaerales bacterium]HRQ76438.1 hypothetical protein [Phycisphaerales bacterium]